MSEQITGTSRLGESSPSRAGKSLWSVYSSQAQLVTEPPMAKQENKQVLMLKLKSNFARDRTVSVGDCYLRFNGDGEANVPPHFKETLDREMTVRPGRYQWVQEQVSDSPEPEAIVEPVVSEPTFSLEEDIEKVLDSEEEEEPKAEPIKVKPNTRIKKAVKTAKKK